MTLEGPSECSNWSSKCPFTPKDTYRHCQHLTVAQNAGPVRPFPAPPPDLTRSARGPQASIAGRTHGPGRGRARAGVGRAEAEAGHPRARAFSLGGHAGGAGLWLRASIRRRRSDDVAAQWRPQRAQGHPALSRPFRNPARAASLRRPPRNRFGCPLCARLISRQATPVPKTAVSETPHTAAQHTKMHAGLT
jgi:hypothetical protein